MWRILQHQEADDFVIAIWEAHSLEEFVSMTFEAVGLDRREHVRSDSSFFRPSDIERSVGTPHKTKSLIGWEAKMRFREMIHALVESELEKVDKWGTVGARPQVWKVGAPPLPAVPVSGTFDRFHSSNTPFFQ
jgi:GDPmannose 4,6-dehydratase